MSSMAASRGVEVMVTNRSPKPEERVQFLPAPLALCPRGKVSVCKTDYIGSSPISASMHP